MPGYEQTSERGEVIGKLNNEIAAVADPKVAQLRDLAVLPTSMAPAEFGQLVADQAEK